MQDKIRVAVAVADQEGWASTYAILRLDGLQELGREAAREVDRVFQRVFNLLSCLRLPHHFPAFALGDRILLVLPGGLDLGIEIGELLREVVPAGPAGSGRRTLSIGLASSENSGTAESSVLLRLAATRAESALGRGGDLLVHTDPPVSPRREETEAATVAPAEPRPERSDTGSDRRIEILERRIQKLVRALEETESKVGRAVPVESGVASEYRCVQGISEDDEDHSLKMELMAAVFAANLALKSHRSKPTSEKQRRSSA